MINNNSDQYYRDILLTLRSDLWSKVEIDCYRKVSGNIHSRVYNHITDFHQLLEIMRINTIDLIK